MPNASFPTQSIAVAGTGSSASLIASTAGQSIRVWQLLVAGTANDTVSITYTAAGTSTTAKIIIAANSTAVIPFTGAPWAIADTGTAVSFTAATTTTVTAFYSKGQGG